MKKIDIVISLITGEVVALFFLNLLKSVTAKGGLASSIIWSLIVVFPILSVFCLWIAYLIGKRFIAIYQLAKFLLVGALATIFDLGTLALFLNFFAIEQGGGYDLFKGASFIIATAAKYFVDKFWAFEKKEKTEMGKEFTQFFLVTLIGLGVNVGVAHIVVNQIGPHFGLPVDAWAQVGGIIAVLVTFAWNFVAYKFIVFKK